MMKWKEQYKKQQYKKQWFGQSVKQKFVLFTFLLSLAPALTVANPPSNCATKIMEITGALVGIEAGLDNSLGNLTGSDFSVHMENFSALKSNFNLSPLFADCTFRQRTELERLRSFVIQSKGLEKGIRVFDFEKGIVKNERGGFDAVREKIQVAGNVRIGKLADLTPSSERPLSASSASGRSSVVAPFDKKVLVYYLKHDVFQVTQCKEMNLQGVDDFLLETSRGDIGTVSKFIADLNQKRGPQFKLTDLSVFKSGPKADLNRVCELYRTPDLKDPYLRELARAERPTASEVLSRLNAELYAHLRALRAGLIRVSRYLGRITGPRLIPERLRSRLYEIEAMQLLKEIEELTK